MMALMLRRSTTMDDEEDDLIEFGHLSWRDRVRDWIVERPRDAVALLVAVVATGAIAINALFLQNGPHPAPLFALRQPVPEHHATTPPRPRPAPDNVVQAGFHPPRSQAELVTDIQRGLATRGYYDGPVDGMYGPKTDAAVRDFAQAVHLKVGNEPDEALLQNIIKSAVKDNAPVSTAALPRRHRDPIADLIGPSPQVLAVQRALTDFGYGQIKPTGIADPDTVAAIEKFERSRRLPVTGQISDYLIRELASVTGRPLE
jgi:peptidoglycan hydrolase-like protein with peptidoglycan-binding domain